MSPCIPLVPVRSSHRRGRVRVPAFAEEDLMTRKPPVRGPPCPAPRKGGLVPPRPCLLGSLRVKNVWMCVFKISSQGLPFQSYPFINPFMKGMIYDFFKKSHSVIDTVERSKDPRRNHRFPDASKPNGHRSPGQRVAGRWGPAGSGRLPVGGCSACGHPQLSAFSEGPGRCQ